MRGRSGRRSTLTLGAVGPVGALRPLRDRDYPCGMARPVVITTVPEAPDVERHRRMWTYVVMMIIRTACFISMIFVHGWWQLALFLGALLLPYLAVTRANVPFAPRRVAVESASSALPSGDDAAGAAPDTEPGPASRPGSDA